MTSYQVKYPVWVKQGERFHEQQAILWQRRNLSRFNLDQGRIHQNIHASSDRYCLHGIADMVVETEDAIYPVEFKLDSSIQQKKGAILQLAAYAMIMEDFFQKTCTTGFLSEGEKYLHKIDITSTLKEETLNKTSAIRRMINTGIKPDSPATVQQCSNCEYINYCNDR